MTQYKKRWVLGVVLGVSSYTLFAQQPSSVPPFQGTTLSDTFTGKAESLQDHSFNVVGLKVSLNIKKTLGSPTYLTLRVDNPSNMFREFHSEDLVLVDAKNIQQVLGTATFDPQLKLNEIPIYHIAPGATVFRQYMIFVNAPYKLYFGEKLIAEITI